MTRPATRSARGGRATCAPTFGSRRSPSTTPRAGWGLLDGPPPTDAADRGRVAAPARAGRVHRRAAGRQLLDLRGPRRAGRLRARLPLRRDGAADRADGAPRRTTGAASAGPARTLLPERPDAEPRPPRGRAGATGDLTLYSRLRRDAGRRPLAPARLGGRLRRAAGARDRLDRSGRPRARRPTAPRPNGRRSSRRRSATGGPRCTTSSLARAAAWRRWTRDRQRDRRSAGSVRPATSARRSRSRRPISCRWSSRRSTASPGRFGPPNFGVYCATDSWWLLRRLRNLGFKVHWPGWVMSSIPLPGLDRYMPMRPPHLL